MTTPAATTPPPPVHEEFAPRLKAAGVMQDSAYYAARWAGVTRYADDLGVGPVLDLVRLLAGERLPGDRPAGFRAALREADPGFTPGDNAFEMALLAGFALVRRWGDPVAGVDPTADAAALAVLTWDFGGRSDGTPVAAFVSDARAYRDQRATAVAAEVPARPKAVDVGNVKQLAVAAAASANAGSTAVPGLGTLLTQLATTVGALAAHERALGKYIDEALAGQREETDVAWWLLGEHSRDLRSHVGDLPAAGAPVVLGKELGDLARRLPGSPAARAVLDRMLRAHRAGLVATNGASGSAANGAATPASRSGRRVAAAPPARVALAEAVNCLPSPWRESWARALRDDVDGSLAPVLSAVKRSLLTADAADWAPTFAAAAGFDPRDERFARPALTLAEQAYDECLLLEAVAAARDEE